jgi:hypothetical protein
MVMATSSNIGNPTARTIVVVILALLMLGVDALSLRSIWHPRGLFGYGTNVDGVVTGVDRGSPADAADIRVGDRLDESTMTPQQRWDLIQIPAVDSAGMSRTFEVYHDGVRRTVTLVSTAEAITLTDQAVTLMSALGALVFIGIGVAIVLLRPDPATWGFFLFCIGYAPASQAEFNLAFPAPWVLYGSMALTAILAAGLAGLIVFALRFLQSSVSGWRRWAELIAPALVFLGVTVVGVLQIWYTYFIGQPAESIAHVGFAFTAAGALVVIVALIDTYIHRGGAERQRIRWVVFGFGVALVSELAVTIVQTEATNTPLVVTSAMGLLTLIAPISVAYAVVKHRVIDVNFVVSRTLVYGILTTIFVGIFAFIDWFVGRVLDQTRWALVAEIGVAISVGFWLNGLHARVDRFVDSVLFRRRHAAEHRLGRLARGLPHATSMAVVDTSLIAEPYDALDLTSAALFRRDVSGRYERVNAVGWPAGTADELSIDDPLILHLQAERGAIRLGELHWSRDDAPSGAARPALALPIVVRHELEAIALFGGHRGGEDFDPDETHWLNALAAAAGAAYDHLAADALRHELERVTRENESQRLTLERNGLLAT